VQALLRFVGSEIDARPPGRPNFTPNPRAKAFLIANPFVFLLTVNCDQNIPAERAW
jgi:hypothetical protein